MFRMAPVSGTIVVTVPESVNVIILPSTILFVEDIGSSRSSRRGREGREERFILVVGPDTGRSASTNRETVASFQAEITAVVARLNAEKEEETNQLKAQLEEKDDAVRKLQTVVAEIQ